MGELSTTLVHILLFISLYFEVFLLITYFENTEKRRGRKQTATAPSDHPSVAIFVPAYNEENTVIGTINSLLELTYPKDKLRILAIDDGSTDATWEKLTAFKNNPQVELYQKPNGGKHTALNFALTKTEAELVGCLDADSFVEPDALMEMVKHFEDESVSAVTPGIKVHDPRTVLERIQKTEYALAVFIRKTFALLDAIFVTPGPFSLFRREVFSEIGTYRKAHNTEDLEIALRLQQAGFKIGNAPTAIVHTRVPTTLRQLYRQRLRWTYGFLKNMIDYRSMLFNSGHGNLGLFILPIALLSIFIALFFFALILLNLGAMAIDKLVQVQVIGIQLPRVPEFDWFFINTQSVLFLVYILVALTFVLIIIGKKLIQEKRAFSFDIVYYLLLYGLLAPFWLGRAVVNTATSRESSWTKEKAVR